MKQAGREHHVFISYHWRDRHLVEPIARWLSTEGRLSVFFDRWYLVPGQPWPQALEQAVGSCDAVAVCIGPGGLGSWQQREMNLALERQAREPGVPVIPVLLPGADPVLGFLGQNTWVDLRDLPAEPALLAALASAIRGEPPGVVIRDHLHATRASVCPYRGLLHFREEDAPFFFGREVAIQQLLTALDRHRFTAVVGPSGSGKSSVVRAGLAPRVRKSRDPVWEIATVVPGDRPLRAIAAAFVPLLQPDMLEVDLLLQIDRLARAFAEGQTALRDVVQRLLIKQPGTERVLLIVDQWEELYTLTHDPEARQRFVELLLDASTHAPVAVVLTLRGDFVGDALAYRPLADRMQGAQVNVGPMTRDELMLAIGAPANQVGLEFEPGLVARILDDVDDEPGHLPLLEFVLKRLWDMKKGQVLLHGAYDQIGKLAGAIANKAESVFATLSELEQDAVRRVFLQLARPGDGRDYTRRRATSAELPELSATVVKRLADERLVVTGQTAGTAETTVEVSHEALIQHWDRLRGWLDRDREFLLWRQRLRPLIGEWQHHDEAEASLLHGSFLSEAERWRKERPGELTADERRYIEQSTDLEALENEKQRQRQEQELAQARALAEAERQSTEERENRIADQRDANQKLTRLVILLGLTVVGLLALGSRALYLADKARAAAHDARIGLAANHFRDATVRVQGGNAREALPFFAVALRLDPDNPAIRAASIAALLEIPLSTVVQHGGAVRSAAFSADGTRLVTASEDTTARVWDTRTGQAVGAPLQHAGPIQSAAFSKDGARVVTASEDATSRVWDARTGQAVDAPLRHARAVRSAAFSADGTRVVTASADHTARVWDARTGQVVGSPLQHAGAVQSAVFSADGTRVVTASADHTARVWDARTGQAVGAPLRHAEAVQSAAFSADGTRVVTASADRTARVWDARTGQPLGAPMQHANAVWSAVFNGDGTRVVTASFDNTAQVWDARTGQAVGAPLQHAGGVSSAAFSTDGTRVVTASGDATARVWDARTGQAVGAPLQHARGVSSATFSGDGTRVATASFDNTARVWDARTGQLVGAPLQHADIIQSAAFSADGKQVVTASNDKTARMWDARTGRAVAAPLQHAGAVNSAAFSTDGTRVVTASADATARVWDARTGQVGPPLEHGSGVNWAAFSSDGTRVVTASADATARVWDTRTGQAVGAPLQHTRGVHLAAFSPDGTRVVTASDDTTAQVWDARSGRAVGAALQHASAVRSAAFSADGTRVVTASFDNTARVWDARTGQAVGAGAPLQHANAVRSAAFSADGTRVLTASDDNTARLWDARTGQTIGATLQHTSFVSAAFSADGTRVVTASFDNTARLWDARTGLAVGAPLRHAGAVRSAAFNADGTRVVTVADDNTARLWDVPTGLVSEAALLAEAAEAVSGYAVNPTGSLVRLEDAPARLEWLMTRVAGAPSGQPTAVSVLRWLFDDPWVRTISPLSTTTVPNYIIERLQRCSSEARREAELHFLGHPMFQRVADACPPVPGLDAKPPNR